MNDLSAFSLRGKTAIITGGSGGIGRGCARAFARAGANIVIASVPPEDIAPTLAEIEKVGAAALGIVTDVSNAGQIDRMVAETKNHFGGVDILVNVAGGSYSRNPHTPRFARAPLLELGEKDFMGAFEVNVKGTFLCAKAVVPIMKAQGNGVIINVGSGAARGGPTRPDMSAYAAAKAAVMNLTINMAHQWAPEIRVNCIAPGIVSVPRAEGERFDDAAAAARIALRRAGTPEDIGNVALFLASDASAFVTGAIIDVDGGK